VILLLAPVPVQLKEWAYVEKIGSVSHYDTKCLLLLLKI